MAAKKKKKELEMLLVQSKVKDFVREHDMMCASDLTVALNEAVGELLEKAIKRAEANGRKTARASDI